MSSMIHPKTVPMQPAPTVHNSLSNQAAMESIFPKMPRKDGYGNEEVNEAGNQYLLGKNNIDPDWDKAVTYWGFKPETSLNYAANGAPAYSDVETGGGGLPSTPFTPNLVSPGPGSMNPSDMAPLPSDYHPTENVQWGNGPGVSSMSPSVSAENIQSGVVIGQPIGGNVATVGAGSRSWPDTTAG